MGKADQLLKAIGGGIAESASHRAAPVALPSAAIAAGSSLTPDRLAGVTRSKSALEIPLSKIEPDPDQPREEFDEDSLERLAGSLKSRGVLQPIRVRWDEGRGRYVILAGERRWRAAGRAGLATIPCVVDDRPLDAAGRLALQMVENCLREDLRPVEQARAFRALMELNGWSGNQLARELGVSQSSVSQAMALLGLPESVREAVDEGSLPASTAYAIAALDDAGAQEALASRVVAEGLSRAEAVKAVRDATPQGRAPGRAATKAGAAPGKGRGRKLTARVIRTPRGRVTAELRKGEGLAAIRDLLREALAAVESDLSGSGGEAAA